MAALDLLALNNPAAHTAIGAAGGRRLLEGLAKHGGSGLREATSELLRGVASPDTLTVAVDTASHAKQAHSARLRHSKVLHSAFGMQRAVAPQQAAAEGGEEEEED